MLIGRLIIFYLAARLHTEVLMGFEIETSQLAVDNEILPSDPVMAKDAWKLFTDMHGDDGYTLEFATNYGYTKEVISKAAEEIQGTLITIIASIRKSAERFTRHNAFKKLTSSYFDYINELDRCIMQEKTFVCKMNVNDQVIKEALDCFLSKLEEKLIIPNLKLVLVKLNKNVKNNTKEKVERLEKKLASLDKQLKGRQNGKIKMRQKTIKSELRKLENEVTRKVYCEYIESKYKDVWKNNKWFAKDEKTNFLKTIQAEPEQELAKLKQTAKMLTKHYGFISEIFYKRDKSLELKKKFQPYCPFQVIKVGESYRLDVCDASSVKASFQLTYQFPISAVTRVLDYYATFCKEDYSPDLTQRLLELDIPYDLVWMSCILRKSRPFNYLYLMNYTSGFDMLWSKTSKKRIMRLTEELYGRQEEDRQAEGLFYLFLSYALTIFRRPGLQADIDKQEEGLPYGPKAYLLLMSRISFSEMFDGMKAGEQRIFVKLLQELCGVDVASKKPHRDDKDEKKLNVLACKKMKLVKYGVMQGFDYAPEVQDTDPLTLFDWARSIIYKRERYNKQPKIKSRDPNESYGKNNRLLKLVSSDKLSPPLCYTRNLDEELYENDQELMNKYGSKSVYSMGAYTGVKPGHTIIEFRAFSAIKVPVDEIHEFIKGHPMTLFDTLNGTAVEPSSWESNVDFNDEHMDSPIDTEEYPQKRVSSKILV